MIVAQYSVIEFEDGGVAVIATKSFNEKQSFVSYPPNDKKHSATKMAMSLENIGEGWPIYKNVTFLHTYGKTNYIPFLNIFYLLNCMSS